MLSIIDRYVQMRLGTQTLIQALQSVPWAEEADGDDDPQTPSAMSEDEDASHEGVWRSIISCCAARLTH